MWTNKGKKILKKDQSSSKAPRVYRRPTLSPWQSARTELSNPRLWSKGNQSARTELSNPTWQSARTELSNPRLRAKSKSMELKSNSIQSSWTKSNPRPRSSQQSQQSSRKLNSTKTMSTCIAKLNNKIFLICNLIQMMN